MRKPRFIAGAVCPQCDAADRTVLHHRDDGVSERRCIVCGYMETLDSDATPRPGTPPDGRAGSSGATVPTVVRVIGEGKRDPE